MKTSDSSPSTIVNPAAFAEAIREEQLPHIDHLVTGEKAERKIGSEAHLREEARALNLGHAAGHASYGDALSSEVREPLAEHHGLEAQLEAAEPRRHVSEQLHASAANLVVALRAVPFNSIDPLRKRLNNVAKVLLITGDTSVLGDQVYRASTPIALALLLGLSLATSVVAVGAKCGHEIAAAHQRKERGDAPDGAISLVRPLYDDGTAEERYRFWLHLAYMAAAVMFLALFFIGHGSGDAEELAVGYGLLGALTVAGSAGAEAYATNDAAEQQGLAENRLAESEDALKEFEGLEARSAAASSFATSTEHASRHSAVATAATVTVTANRLPDSPEVGGYVDGGHLPVTAAPPSPVELSQCRLRPQHVRDNAPRMT